LRNASALSVYMRVIPNLDVRISNLAVEMISSRVRSKMRTFETFGTHMDGGFRLINSGWLQLCTGHWAQTSSYLSPSPHKISFPQLMVQNSCSPRALS